MKRLLAVICFLYLLCGCANFSALPGETSGPDALDHKLPLDSLGAIYDTWIDLPEAPVEPNLYSLQGDLLLVSSTYQGPEACRLTLHRINTRLGQVVNQAEILSKGYATAQVYGDTVCLCSPPGGKVWFLNSNLERTLEFTFPENYNEWYISHDLKFLYELGWDTGIICYNLTSGAQKQLLPPNCDVSVRNRRGDVIAFCYVDAKTQIARTGLLDLASGKIAELPAEGSLCSYEPGSGLWLSNLFSDDQTNLLGDGQGNMRVFTSPNSYCILTEQAQILLRNYTTGYTGLYTAQGELISRFQLPMNALGPTAYTGDDMVWDPDRGGYFLIYTESQNVPDTDEMEGEPIYHSKLAFWDVSKAGQGEDLALYPYSTGRLPGGNATEQAVYARAQNIAKRFDVTVLVADQCLTKYENFNTVSVTDPQAINAALTELEKALSKYPEGFFKQLRYNTIKSLEFSVVGKLEPLREDESGTITAFAQPLEDRYIIVADAQIVTDTTFHHELSHVIDRRLQWDAEHREKALYSEENWAAMNPKGFEYDMTYALHHDRWNFNDKYFMSSYACTYPTEDRATIWEQTMVGNDYPFQSGPMRKKLEYYCACVRDCFDTTGWPEILPWEKVLQ